MYQLNLSLVPWSTIWRFLTPAAQTVFLAVVSECNRDDLDGIFLTYQDAEQRLGLDRSTFHRAIIILESLDFIEVIRGGFLQKLGNRYFPSHRWERWGLSGFRVRGRLVSDLWRFKPRSARTGRFLAVSDATHPVRPNPPRPDRMDRIMSPVEGVSIQPSQADPHEEELSRVFGA